jgi:hypothetical protein
MSVNVCGAAVRSLLAAAAGAALCLVAAPTFADVITFDYVSPGYTSHAVTSPYTELDYQISAPNGLYYLGTGDPRYAGENNLFDSNYHDTTTLSTIDGKSFSLQSIDLAEMYLGQRPSVEDVTFTGTLKGGGTVTQTFDVSNTSFQTFAFNSTFENLASVSWDTGGGFTPQFANIVLSSAPEPATWAMLLLGVGAIGVALRKRGLALAA